MSIIPVTQLSAQDLAHLGNNLTRRRRHRMPRQSRRTSCDADRRRQLADVLLSVRRVAPVLVRKQ